MKKYLILFALLAGCSGNISEHPDSPSQDAGVVVEIIPEYYLSFQLIAGYCQDRKSTRLNSSHMSISYAVFCLKKKNKCMKNGIDGTPVDMQIRISPGSTTTTPRAYNVCVTSIVPSTSDGGSGGSSGTASCTQPSGSGSLTKQLADAHVGCPKDYIVQNNAWAFFF